MYISKRGPQFVLVATLLVMLSPLRCAHTHPMLRERDQPAPTMTRVYLYNARHESYVSVHRPRRGGNYLVVARFERKNNHSLLRLETDSIRRQKLFINIYNEEAKRYICFNKRGRVRTSERRHSNNLTCRFHEKLDVSTKTFQYVADEGKRVFSRNRVLSFCGKRQRAVLRRPRNRAGRRRSRHRSCYTFFKFNHIHQSSTAVTGRR